MKDWKDARMEGSGDEDVARELGRCQRTSPYNTGVTKQADLIAYVFEGQPHQRSAAAPLAGTLLEWMEASPRFTAFVEIYRDKIRKKIRVIQEPESLVDLRGELEVAYCLLNDRRLAVAYEPYASAKRRGPDFAVTYRANLVFNIEVARLRVAESGLAGVANGSSIDLRRKEERIVRILLGKLGQMQPGMANLLAIYTGEELARSTDLARLMREVKTRADGKDPSFYAESRYAGPADFYKDFLRLSGILLWADSTQLWVNKQARPALPEKVLRLVSSLPCGASPT